MCSFVGRLCFGVVSILGIEACSATAPQARPLLLEKETTTTEELSEWDAEAHQWWEREISNLESLDFEPEPEPLERMIGRATILYEDASYAHSVGHYNEAEVLLKESLSIYPFLLESNLLLGKIFLIRGAASRDYILINNARLMFELARAIDPESNETLVFLELFGVVQEDTVSK